MKGDKMRCAVLRNGVRCQFVREGVGVAWIDDMCAIDAGWSAVVVTWRGGVEKRWICPTCRKTCSDLALAEQIFFSRTPQL